MARAPRGKERGKRGKKTAPTRRKRSKYLENATEIDYKDHELLRHFMTERGKIVSRRTSGATAKEQRQIKRAIRRARVLGLVR